MEIDETVILELCASSTACLIQFLKQIEKLKAVARALLECEADREQRCNDGLDVAPDKQLYLRAVELAQEALEDGEQA